MNVLVTGSNGQLGSELKALIQHSTFNIQHHDFYFTDRSILDITNKTSVENFCLTNNIKIIINCAAYTAVDKAESDEEMAYGINHKAVETMAHIAKHNNIALIHISTDYVFDGSNFKPYVENDPTNPQSVYGASKLAGEEAMQTINPKNSLIIRTSWVYSSFGNNFVKTMLRLGRERDELGVIFDQVGTPTYAHDLAQAILKIIQNSKLTKGNALGCKIQNSVEIYHYSNEGVCSWYDFAKTIFELSNITCKVNPIETKDYPTPATRPHYSLLNKAKIKKEYNIEIPYWKDSLSACLKILGERN